MDISQSYSEHKIDNIIDDEDTRLVHISTLFDDTECRYCSSEAIVKFGTRTSKINDKPEDNKKVTLLLKQPRYRCNECGKTFVATSLHKHSDHKVTDKLAEYVYAQSLSRPFIDIGNEVGIHTNTARDVFLSAYEQRDKELVFDTPKHLGLERASIIKNATVITNVSRCRVLDLMVGQDVDDIKPSLVQRCDMSEVEYAYIGIWQPYKDLINELAPAATIIIDRHHAFDLIAETVERVRVSIRSTLSTIDRRSLSKDKNILAKRRYDLTKNDEKTLKRWCESHPEIYQAYELKERFCMIWDCTSSHDAKAAYSEWQDSITPAVIAYFTPLITLIDTWSNEVFAYFDNPKFNDHASIVLDLEAAASRLPRRRSFAAVKAALLFNKEKDRYGIKVADLSK
ncbi:transposase [uncultured Psychrobacter sp.]|uniref:transposase n=1 Tax=uncultured Psychrobacter sp. TaxID=259303 RepID=UPI0030D83959